MVTQPRCKTWTRLGRLNRLVGSIGMPPEAERGGGGLSSGSIAGVAAGASIVAAAGVGIAALKFSPGLRRRLFW
jgi:hypothetical protein